MHAAKSLALLLLLATAMPTAVATEEKPLPPAAEACFAAPTAACLEAEARRLAAAERLGAASAMSHAWLAAIYDDDALYAEAIKQLGLIIDKLQRKQVAGDVAKVFAEAGRLREAAAAANRMYKVNDRAWAWKEIAVIVADKGFYDQLLTFARARADDADHTGVLRAVAEALAAGGRLDDALEVARTIPNATARARTHAVIGTTTGDVSLIEAAETMIVASEQSAFLKKIALDAVMGAYAAAGELDRALTLARAVKQGLSRDNTLSTIVSALAGKGRFDDARKVVDMIERPLTASTARTAILIAYADADRPDEAGAVLDEMNLPGFDELATWRIVGALARTGRIAEAEALLAPLEESARKDTGRFEIAAAHLAAGDTGAALAVARQIALTPLRARALATVARGMRD